MQTRKKEKQATEKNNQKEASDPVSKQPT